MRIVRCIGPSLSLPNEIFSSFLFTVVIVFCTNDNGKANDMKKILSFLLLIALLLSHSAAAESTDSLLATWRTATQKLVDAGVFPPVTLSKGAIGSDVAALQLALADADFYTGSITGRFDDATVKAVKAFENANHIKADGKLSPEEQALLYGGAAASAAITDVGKEQPVEVMVWAPKTGKKYHSKSTCSNMKNPSEVTIREAKSRGLTPCSKCNPPD